MGTLILCLIGILAAVLAGVYVVARRKNADLIVRASLARRHEPAAAPLPIFFGVVDPFEPFWKNDDVALGLERVRRWRERYPAIAAQYRDRGGKPPRHAFFYPAEDYDR